MKRLLKFFKGASEGALNKIVPEKKEATPEEIQDYELLNFGANDLDMSLVFKLRQLKHEGKVQVMCHHSGKPLCYHKKLGVDRYFKVRVGEYKFRIAYTIPVCHYGYTSYRSYKILKLDVFSNKEVMGFVAKLAEDFCTEVLSVYTKEQTKAKNQKLKENAELCLSKLDNI